MFGSRGKETHHQDSSYLDRIYLHNLTFFGMSLYPERF